METFFRYATPITYWLLIIAWTLILVFYFRKIKAYSSTDKLLKLLLLVLALDAFRTLFESVYFGAWYTSLSGLIPFGIFTFLAQPQIVFLPKIINLITAVIVLSILIRKWLSAEIKQKSAINELVQTQISVLAETNKILSDAKEKAEENEKRYRELFEANKDGITIFSVTPEGELSNFQEMNEAAGAMLGYTKEELLQMKAPDVEADSSDENLKQRIHELQTKGFSNFETKIKHKNGNNVSVEITVLMINYNNRPAVMNITRDISERKLAEQELIKAKDRAEESEKQFRTLFENAADAIFIADEVSGIIIDANQRAERLMQMEYHEIIGLHQSLLHPHETEKYSVETFRYHQELDDEIRLKTFLENKIVRKDGTEVPVEILATKVFYKGKNCLVGTFRDITKRKQTELLLQEKNEEIAAQNEVLYQTNQELIVSKQRIEESEERFLLAMKASNDGLFDWNLVTNEIYYSPAWKKMLGYEDHELLNDFSVWEKTTDPDDVKKSWELQQKLISNEIDRFVLEFKMKHKDGHWVDILSRAEAIFNERGKAIRIVGTHTDITERKLYIKEIHKLNEELEQRVTDRTAQLEAANKELEAFSYSVSHDLRTPLRALNGFANILTEEYAVVLDDEGKRMLTVISENATKMGYLIDDLLSFARLGRIEIVPSPINMTAMAAAVYDELVPETDKDKIRFVLTNVPAAFGDSSMVKQVWVNLIGNAIKFTSKKTDRHIEVGVIAGDKENIYFVKDNGAGFEMAHASKLFGVFQRLHTLKEFDGIGAGLAIVHRIILRHKGRVWAEGKVNEGATFYFTLTLNK